MYNRKIQVSRGISVVYHSKATDSARLTEIVGVPKTFEKVRFACLEVVNFTEDVLFAQFAGILRMAFFGNKSIFRISRMTENIVHMLRKSSSCRIVDFRRYSTIRLRFSQGYQR